MFKFFLTLSLLVLLRNGEAKFDFNDIRDVIVKNGIFNTTIAMMIDASAKSIPNGILRGNFYNLGSYDGCLAIEDKVGNIHGKYCYATLSIMEISPLLQENQKQLTTMYESVQKKKKVIMQLFPT
ncbi:uncharacterized protein LOC123321156 [Coccinella septempunctata]|uniref:uncharacterized protein LOC123321156 n=1 Tax=Coccinella septempunctata TaxID=41139 RepID=UPI001D06D00B|nr:uncharacterized protein LOC123321156 [Coccinella septempunctata]